MKHFPALTDATINDILNELVEGDHFLKAQKELGTDHKRMDFIKKNFKFIEPKSIILLSGLKQTKSKYQSIKY